MIHKSRDQRRKLDFCNWVCAMNRQMPICNPVSEYKPCEPRKKTHNFVLKHKRRFLLLNATDFTVIPTDDVGKLRPQVLKILAPVILDRLESKKIIF